MSDESQENLSKRERQKQRREARREAERNAAKRARTTRLAVFVVLGLAVAGGIGYFVQQTLAARGERAERLAEAAAESGCTDVQQPESLGAGHFQGPELADNPPEAVYDHRPTTSGRHIGTWARTGVYDSYVDERLTTHNLEHGYVVMWYAEDAPDEQVEALKTLAREEIDGGNQEIIVAQYNAEMDEGASFAFTAWEHRRLCEQFDAEIASAFVGDHMNTPSAPETNAGPHLGEGAGGGIDPETQQAVFPPLDDAAGDPGADDGGEQDAGEDVEGEDADTAGDDAEDEAAGDDAEDATDDTAGDDADGDTGDGGDDDTDDDDTDDQDGGS